MNVPLLPMSMHRNDHQCDIFCVAAPTITLCHQYFCQHGPIIIPSAITVLLLIVTLLSLTYSHNIVRAYFVFITHYHLSL